MNLHCRMGCRHWRHRLHVSCERAIGYKKSLNVEMVAKLQLKFTAFISASRMMPSVTETTTTNLTRVLVMYPYLIAWFTHHVDHCGRLDAYTAKSSMAYSNPRYRSRFLGPFDTRMLSVSGLYARNRL